MGLQTPNDGEILFEGKPLGRKLKAYRRQVQMVFQDPTGSLNPRQTIYEIIAEGLRIHGIHRARTARPRSSWSRRRCHGRGCARPSASSFGIRTSSRAASASAW